jgi:hypothetical protein
LHTVDNALHEDFINWDRLEVLGIDFQHDPDRLDIQQIAASKLYARVTIEPDTSLNVTRVLAGPGARPFFENKFASEGGYPRSGGCIFAGYNITKGKLTPSCTIK